MSGLGRLTSAAARLRQAVVVLIVAIVVATGCGSTASDRAVTRITPSATYSDPVSELTWQMVSGPVGLVDVTPGGPGWVAVGDDGGDMVVWVSPTGTEWQQIENKAFRGQGSRFANEVIAAGPGLVAVGFEDPDDTGLHNNAAVWISTDGLEWERVDDESFEGDGVQEMHAVSDGGPGLVAVGFEYTGDNTDLAVWVTPDGLTWDRVGVTDLTEIGAELLEEESSPNVIRNGSSGIIAVGRVANEQSDEGDGAVWLSFDGTTWEHIRDPAFGGPGTQRLYAVMHDDQVGLIAVGSQWIESAVDAAVWRSQDGRVWQRIDHNTLAKPGIQELSSIASGPTGLIAVGVDGTDLDDSSAGVWISADGTTWTQINNPVIDDAGWLWSIATDGQTMVSVGPGGPIVVARPSE